MSESIQIRREDGRLVLPDDLPRTIEISDDLLRQIVENINELQEAYDKAMWNQCGCL